MQIQKIQNTPYNNSFGSKVIMTPKSLRYLEEESTAIRRKFHKDLTALENNGSKDTVFIDYLDIYDSSPYHYYLQVIKKIKNKLHKSPISGIYKNEKYDIEQAYNQANKNLSPAKQDIFNKYLVK